MKVDVYVSDCFLDLCLNIMGYPTTLGRLAEGSNASSSELRHCVRIPLRKRKHFSSPARAGPIGNIESLGAAGGRVSVIAPLPERLPGLIEGSL